jgi:hypothetical protein
MVDAQSADAAAIPKRRRAESMSDAASELSVSRADADDMEEDRSPATVIIPRIEAVAYDKHFQRSVKILQTQRKNKEGRSLFTCTGIHLL